MGVAIANGLTVSNVAIAAHSYPSYGYLLYRVALSMALGNIWGVLDACGPLGRVGAKTGRVAVTVASRIRRLVRLPHTRARQRRLREWEAQGVSGAVFLPAESDKFRAHSFLDISQNATLRNEIERHFSFQQTKSAIAGSFDEFRHWLNAKP